jgi:hypothetical protein
MVKEITSLFFRPDPSLRAMRLIDNLRDAL